MSDDWEFYPCHIGDNPGSFYVNMLLRGAAPVPDLIDLTFLSLYLLQPRDDGLSAREEFDRLSEIEDAVCDCLESCECRLFYVGRTTSAGQRDFYIYSSNGILVESALQQAMVPFGEYSYETGRQEDPEWKCYLDFLYPTPRDRQFIVNRHLLESFKEENDPLEIPRPVKHWAYFSSREAREKFVELAICDGFQLDHVFEPDERYGAVVTRTDSIDSRSINDVVWTLFDFAEEAGGEYDGWESSIVIEDMS